MKTRNTMMVWFALAVIFLFDSGINPAAAYDVAVKNTTGETIKVFLYTRTTFSWDTLAHSLNNTIQPISVGSTYTFSVPVDSQNRCPSYLAGYNNDLSKGIAMMGCDGAEINNSPARCCENSSFEVYKKSDGTFHFRKK